jgi:hypothetical protein
MEKNNRTNPSQEDQPRNLPQQGQQNNKEPQEGEIRKVVREDDPEAIDDEYEIEQDNLIEENKADSEEENNTSGTKRGNTFNRDAR